MVVWPGGRSGGNPLMRVGRERPWIRRERATRISGTRSRYSKTRACGGPRHAWRRRMSGAIGRSWAIPGGPRWRRRPRRNRSAIVGRRGSAWWASRGPTRATGSLWGPARHEASGTHLDGCAARAGDASCLVRHHSPQVARRGTRAPRPSRAGERHLRHVAPAASVLCLNPRPLREPHPRQPVQGR